KLTVTLPIELAVDGMPIPWRAVETGLTDPNDLICWVSVQVARRYAGAQEVPIKVLRALERLDPTGRAMIEYVLNPHALDFHLPLPNYNPEKALELLDQTQQPEFLRWAALYYLLHEWGWRSLAEAGPSGPWTCPPPSIAPPLEWKRKLLHQMAEILAGPKEESPLIRKMVVYMCGELYPFPEDLATSDQGERIREKLLSMMYYDDDMQNRRWAAYALAEITPPQKAEPVFSAVADLVDRWEQPDPVVFPALCYALLQLRLPDEGPGPSLTKQRKLQELEPRLRLHLYSSNPNLRWWAALVLAYSPQL
ncbi:MAG: hypothetical protein NZ602_01675, partial [Thermoguttaceae bacterium]|nr:hypothetical protein [Thermoguttaceae bacterium]